MATETTKCISIIKYWWNNFQFVYNRGVYKPLRDVNLNNKQIDKIEDDLDQLANDNNKACVTFEEWEIYYKTVLMNNNEIFSKFTTWYNNLMKEKELKNKYDYQWRLPRYKPKDIDLLIYGYYRRINIQTKEQIISDYTDIMKTSINYFGAFEDKFDLNKLKTMRSGNIYHGGSYYRSGIIEYKSLQFVLKLERIKGNKFNVLIEYIGVNGPKYMFKKCELRLSLMYVEKGYKGYYNFTIKTKDRKNEQVIFKEITLTHIQEMIT
eukprot:481222_1